MKKETLRVLSFVAGIILASVTVFGAILQLVQMINTYNSGIQDSKYITYYSISAIKTIAVLVLYGIISYKLIMHYLKNTDESKSLIMPIAVYCAGGMIGNLLAFAFYGIGDGGTIIYLLLEAAGLILVILSQFGNMEKALKMILGLVSIGICFLLEFIFLFGSSDLGILICLLYVSFFVIAFLYYLFKMLNEKNVTIVEEDNNQK